MTTQGTAPWFDECHRWAQTNTSEIDVADFDVSFWKEQWRLTRVQAVITNGVAGFAAFPSANPLVARSKFDPDRDLLGEIATAARDLGLRICARMDSAVVGTAVLEAFPQWRVVDALGNLLPEMCINSAYRTEFVHGLYEEISDRYGVDAFSDNGGTGRNSLCYCDTCRSRWSRDVGGPFPLRASLADPEYRAWKRWNDDTVVSNWIESEEYIRTVAGSECLFLGLLRKFSPLNRSIAAHARLVLMDCQSRNDSGTFREHVDEGRFMKSLVGGSRNVAVASSMTQHSHGYFRITTDPPAETNTYMLSGIAGGFDPWWHYPTAYSPDRRAYAIPQRVFEWHEANSEYLTNRTPVATAGIVRSDRNDQFFGRDAGPIYQPKLMGEVTQAAYRGMAHLMFDARVPYLPVHIDHVPDDHSPAVLVLPNMGGMSDDECERIRSYVRNGGAIIASGMTSLFNEDGEPRVEFGLSDVLGVRIVGEVPDRRALIDAKQVRDLDLADRTVFDALGILEFGSQGTIASGGVAIHVAVDDNRSVLATTKGLGNDPSPVLIAGHYGKGRVIYCATDMDRHYLRAPQPAHASLFTALARWCAGEDFAVETEGAGFIGNYLYRQNDTQILHLLNFSAVDEGDQLIDTAMPIGPLVVHLNQCERLNGDIRSLTSSREWHVEVVDGRMRIPIEVLTDHEVLVIS